MRYFLHTTLFLRPFPLTLHLLRLPLLTAQPAVSLLAVLSYFRYPLAGVIGFRIAGISSIPRNDRLCKGNSRISAESDC